MARVLCISTRSTPVETLSLLSHQVTLAQSSEAALRELDSCDVAVVDARDDLAWARSVATTLRAARQEAALLLLVPVNALALLSREWGLSYFVADGSEPAEFDARIRLLVRPQDAEVLVAGPIRIDEAAYHATLAGDPLDLTYTEFELLRYLMQHPGRVLTREVLLSQVWGYDYFGGTRTVDVHVRRLRAKLGQYDYYIATVRNVGYRFTSAREVRE